MRPSTVLQYLQKNGFQSSSVQFLEKYQQTMDYFGIAPIRLENEPLLSAEEVIIRFFQAKNGLPRFIQKFSWEQKLQGYIIEVKSRTSVSSWPPFHSSFSPNQELMLEEVKKFNFEIVLCGVTFEPNWNLSIVFYNQKGSYETTEDREEKSIFWVV